MTSGGTAACWKGPRQMPITDLLERNHKLYGGETALVEINPEIQEKHRVTWKEYELIEPASTVPYRREITWGVFDEKANRVANMLPVSYTHLTLPTTLAV